MKPRILLAVLLACGLGAPLRAAGPDTQKTDPAVGGLSAGGTVDLGNFACFGVNGGCIGQVAVDTPDASMLLTGSTSNAWIIAEYADRTFDFAHAAAANPTLFVHSTNQSATQWLSLTHNGTDGLVSTGAGNLSLSSASTIISLGASYVAITGNNTFFSFNSPGATLDSNWIGMRNPQTPDQLQIGLSSTARTLSLHEGADGDFDFNNGPCGTAACTHPTLTIHSSTQNTTEYHALSYYGSAGEALKTLTEAVATAVIQIPVAAGAGTGGTLEYTVFASDGTDHQVRMGSIRFAVEAKAAVEICTLSAAAETGDGSVIAASLGTLTYAITCDTSPANAVNIAFNATSSLVQTTLQIRYTLRLVGPGLPAPQ